MKHILIVDDEEKIRFVVREYAEFEGYKVSEAQDGMEAVELCREVNFDLIIMDIMMPRLDGYMAVREIRKNSNVPVIMLSARGEEYDKLFGFELGIDDYVVKPFSCKELMARVGAIMGRVAPEQVRESLQFGGLTVDTLGRRVLVDGKEMQLTPKEYELLFYMVTNRGIALSRERMLRDIWGYSYTGDDRTLDTHIKMLRSNLGPYRGYIVTLRGMGYKFEPGERVG
jgi:two-component system response regulator ResD